MKRVVICVFILTAMLIAGIGLYIHTDNVADELDGRLAALEAGSSDPVTEAVSISEDWEDFCAFNVFLTNIEGAAEVSESLVRLIAKARHDKDDIAEECVTARYQLEHFRMSSKLRIENIF